MRALPLHQVGAGVLTADALPMLHLRTGELVRVWETTSLLDAPGTPRARGDGEIARFAPLMRVVLRCTYVVRGLWG